MDFNSPEVTPPRHPFAPGSVANPSFGTRIDSRGLATDVLSSKGVTVRIDVEMEFVIAKVSIGLFLVLCFKEKKSYRTSGIANSDSGPLLGHYKDINP